MGLFKNFNRRRWLYNGLIVTFIILYAATAFVSFYHAITFFNIANAIWLSVILSLVAEIGQASVLFSILLSENKYKFLSWFIMFILTTLQVIGNVVSSFDWIVANNDAGLDGFKRSILFAVQTDDPEMFRIIVAWISGALLPVIALSMTALVAQNIEFRTNETDKDDKNDKNDKDEKDETDLIEKENIIKEQSNTNIDAKDLISEISKIRPTEELIEDFRHFLNTKKPKTKEDIIEEIKKESLNLETQEEVKKNDDELPIIPIEENENPVELPIISESPDISIDENENPIESSIISELPDENEINFNEPEEIFKSDDDFGPVDLTNEIPDNLLVTSVEEEENIDTSPEVKITLNNGIVENVEISPTESEKDIKLDETPPLIELEKEIQETPLLKKTQVSTQYPTFEQLERIRQIARDNLKKK